MHKNMNRKYYFINKFETNIIDKLDKQTVVIYRNYNSKSLNKELILKIKNYCKKKGNKFYLSNNFKIALNLNLDGVYLPSFNKSYKHLSYSLKKNFKIIGSAHSLRETTIKKNQKVEDIFISSIFKKNKNYLGINKFKKLISLTNLNVIALGGINQKNLNKLKLIKLKGFAGISYFNKKKGP